MHALKTMTAHSSVKNVVIIFLEIYVTRRCMWFKKNISFPFFI